MLYRLLRAVVTVALRWYYADIVVQGAARIPGRGPLLVIANHPNALVDALVVITALPRRVRLTAKATLFEQPLLASLLRLAGVIPLRRAQDEQTATSVGPGSARNVDAFRAVTQALLQNGAVLVFPEGISHDAPSLARLKTGVARMALDAHGARVDRLHILPVGLIFEQKERFRSRVLVRIGLPLEIAAMSSAADVDSVRHLTAHLEAALRQMTLNFANDERARRAVQLARALAAIIEAPPTLDRSRVLALEVDLASRIEAATDALAMAPDSVSRQADELITRVGALEDALAARHATLADIQISPRFHHGVRFVVREIALASVALPVVLFGRLLHWLPLRAARMAAMRSLTHNTGRDQPAMRSIVYGVGFVLVWYVGLAVLLAQRVGLGTAMLWIVGACLAAQIDLRLRDRFQRAWQRARTYLAIRADPELHRTMLEDANRLVSDAWALERQLLVGAD